MPRLNRNDPGSGSGPPRYPGTFLLALREAVAGLGWQIRRWRGALVECVDAEGNERNVGLDNLYRRARLIDRDKWPELVAEFLRTVAGVSNDELLPESLASAADRLLVRLGPLHRPEEGEAAPWSQRLENTDLVVNLVVDSPDRMCYVTNQLVTDSGAPGSAWLERALANLLARTPAECLAEVHEDTGIRLCAVGDAYDSSRALILDRLLPEAGADGFFVAVPARDQLLVLPVDEEALAQLHVLRLFATQNFKSTPYPISDEVYWVRGGVWRPFPIEVRDDKIVVEPPAEFAEVLKRLMPGELADDEMGADEAEGI
jgi:hypothetical protein